MDMLREFLQTCFSELGCSTTVAAELSFWSLVVGLILLSGLVGTLCNRLLTPIILHIVARTQTVLDDYVFNRPVLRALWRVVPGLLFCILLPSFYDTTTPQRIVSLLNGAAQIYVTITIVLLISAFLTNLGTYTTEQERFKMHHIIGIVQFLKLIVYFLGAIVIVALLLGRNPAGLIAGLGAAATVLMLVFKDTILGLVAGIQLSVNKMLKPGDWITIEKQGINGLVEQVTLTTVKVRNFDNTISTIPPYTLISESFQNWEGMRVRGARRVKRALFIDISTVKLVGQAEIKQLRTNALLAAVDEEAYGEKGDSITFTTNLTLFRHSAEQYLRQRQDVLHQEDWQWVMARQLAPTAEGLPIEFWFYLSETDFARYEDLAAQCMEHLVAMIPHFGLRLYQKPSGYDLAGTFLAGQSTPQGQEDT